VVKIIATDEQIQQLMASKDAVEFVDNAGTRLGMFARNGFIRRKRAPTPGSRFFKAWLPCPMI